MAQTFTQDTDGSFRLVAAITQNTAGIPGVAEAGDRFGAAVAVGGVLPCADSFGMAVGSPGEDIGTKADTGLITVAAFDSSSVACPAKMLYQGSGLAGAAEVGDKVGSVLRVMPVWEDGSQTHPDRLLIGVPHEDIGAVINAGMVQPYGGSLTSNGTASPTLQFPLGVVANTNYGMVLAAAS